MRIRADTAIAISKAVTIYSGTAAYKIIPLPGPWLKKSDLGKTSRKYIRESFEAGDFEEVQEIDAHLIRVSQRQAYQFASTLIEGNILKVYHELFDDQSLFIGVGSNLFELGISSLDVLRLRNALQKRFGIDIPISVIFEHPMIRELASAIEKLLEKETKSYDPVSNRSP